MIKPRLESFPEPVKTRAEQLYGMLNLDAEKQRAHIDELLVSLNDGDIRRGQVLFNSPALACSSCHAIGYLGGNMGPDLTAVGTIRERRDLLEAVVYPSASFVRSFEPINVTTRDDIEYTGILKEEGPTEIVIVAGLGTEVRIRRADILEMSPGTISPMPGGLVDTLPRQALADLIAFLKATKW